MIIGGVILLILAGIFFWVSRSQKGKLDDMNAVDTYNAALLGELHTRVVTMLGSEALAEPCELEGVIEADQPLKAPLSGTPCVAYTLTVTREYEEDQTSTDSEGKTTTSTVRGSDTMESNSNQIDFWVRDDSGRTLVRPEGADLDMKQSKEEFKPTASGGSSTISFGLFTINVPRETGRRRTLGYRATEEILETGLRVYVLGCAGDHNGSVAVMKAPKHKPQRFMVSRRTERELAASAASWSKNMSYAAAGSGVLGLILLVLGMIS